MLGLDLFHMPYRLRRVNLSSSHGHVDPPLDAFSVPPLLLLNLTREIISNTGVCGTLRAGLVRGQKSTGGVLGRNRKSDAISFSFRLRDF